MIRPVKTENLKVGMYVKLGEHAHLLPLFEEEFKISSEKQIVNIIDKGISIVEVDADKSNVEVPLPDFKPAELIADELRQVIEDPSADSNEKANAVYDHSIKMMDRIISEPTAENILSGKRMIHDVVELILADDETADFLTKITSHDYYTYTHSVNVGLLGILLCKGVFKGSDSHDLDELGAGFFLHDVGKCEIPSYLINKPGRLMVEEWLQMRMHPIYGKEILARNNQLTAECNVIVMQRHERWNGTGYPSGLKKDDIHLYARMCSIADVYEALTSTRAYKEKLTTFEALKLMRGQMINHFGKDLFETFVSLFK